MRKANTILVSSIYLILALLNSSCIRKHNTAQSSAPKYDMVVAADGSGTHTTVQAAIDASPAFSNKRTTIFIAKGRYYEVLTIDSTKTNLSFIGENIDKTVLTYDNSASKINPKTSEKYGTTGSSSIFIFGDGFHAYNLTMENNADPKGGQAVAVRCAADRSIFMNCKFLGNQDTYYAHSKRMYLANCYIEGTTDFIFGWGIAFFQNCHLHSKGGVSITAASTQEHVKYGMVFNNCKITGIKPKLTDLGRPWRPYASVTFMNSEISDAILPRGWNNWGKAANDSTARFAEYNNTGAGADLSKRPSWTKQLTAEEATEYTVNNVLKADVSDPQIVDNWNPLTEIEQETTKL